MWNILPFPPLAPDKPLQVFTKRQLGVTRQVIEGRHDMDKRSADTK
jgi:hypothetical protein